MAATLAEPIASLLYRLNRRFLNHRLTAAYTGSARLIEMPVKSTIRKPKRPSVTDSMHSSAEKILSAVDRGLIELVDSDASKAKLDEIWKLAPTPCVVVVPGPKGVKQYIYHIRERLKMEGFLFDGDTKLWYRPKRSGEMSLQETADWVKDIVRNANSA